MTGRKLWCSHCGYVCFLLFLLLCFCVSAWRKPHGVGRKKKWCSHCGCQSAVPNRAAASGGHPNCANSSSRDGRRCLACLEVAILVNPFLCHKAAEWLKGNSTCLRWASLAIAASSSGFRSESASSDSRSGLRCPDAG